MAPHQEQPPSDVTLGSCLRAWWLCQACSCGYPHVWQTGVQQRALKGTGCPVCAGSKPCRCSSLAALRPDVAAGWAHTANAGLTPEDVPVSSHRKVAWTCIEHEDPYTWTAAIKNRTRSKQPSGCPRCAREARGYTKSEHQLLLQAS